MGITGCDMGITGKDKGITGCDKGITGRGIRGLKEEGLGDYR